MIDLGIVRPGSTIRIPFSSFDKDDGSSITMTNYAAADILIYKDGSTTERASTAGFTATTDFDTKTGKHLAIIDLADNTTAGFYNAGSEYLVAIDAVTVDAVTTGGWIARFRIGHPAEWYSTTIATLATQTSFTLTTGPAEDDALNGHWCIIHDIASAVQCGKALILDYTGSTKTVTLAAGTTFTAAAGDNISIMDQAPLQPTVLGRTFDVSAGGEGGVDWANVGSPTTVVGLSGTTVKTATDVETDTQDIQSRLPAALGANGNIKADVRDYNGTAGTFASGIPSVNTTQVSGTTQTAGDIIAEIGGIGTAGVAAINADAATDNSAGGISGVTSGTTKVGTETGTYANTSFENASYHVITHSANAIDWVYQFLCGGGTTAIGVRWIGYLTSANDTVTVSAWNHVGGAWQSIGTITGQATTTNSTYNFVLYPRHIGTSSAEIGKVYIRLHCTGMTSPVLNTDQLTVSYSVTSRTVGYSEGSVWVDTVDGAAGTESFVNGTADNAVLTLADALTIASALNMHRFKVANGSTITLGSATTNKVFDGHEWALALDGQDISDSMFIDAEVSGVSSGTDAEFEDCNIGTATIGPFHMYRCGLTATLTLAAAGDYFLIDCFSNVAGTGTPTIACGSPASALSISFRRVSGGITISGINSNCTISIDCVSGGTVTLNGADGNVQVRGMCNVVDNRTGTPTLGTTNNMDARFDAVDSALTTIDDFLDTEIASIISELAKVPKSDGTATWNATALASINGEVLDVLNVDTFAQPGQATPAATTSIRLMLAYLYKAWRNRSTQTASQYTLYNDDATTVDQKATFSDDTTTADRGEVATGP